MGIGGPVACGMSPCSQGSFRGPFTERWPRNCGDAVRGSFRQTWPPQRRVPCAPTHASLSRPNLSRTRPALPKCNDCTTCARSRPGGPIIFWSIARGSGGPWATASGRSRRQQLVHRARYMATNLGRAGRARDTRGGTGAVSLGGARARAVKRVHPLSCDLQR